MPHEEGEAGGAGAPAFDGGPRVRMFGARRWVRRGRPALAPLLTHDARTYAVGLRRWIPRARSEALAQCVEQARALWTADFDGEQFALGRAFYTHLETKRAGEYFANVAESDARVERVLPGFQAAMRDLFASLVGATARQRPGFCGAGVHVFLPDGPVARDGGVVHYDTEGLTPLQLRRRARALSLVVMLRPGSSGAGLRLWQARYEGAHSDEGSDEQLEGPSVCAPYDAGDALCFESYRLHQIVPFAGSDPRISATLHGVEVDQGVWETWF